MKVLLAGGVFRLPAETIQSQQPTPEVQLAAGLTRAGVTVTTVPLEDTPKIFQSKGYDVVHVHHLSRGAVAAAVSYRRIPFVFTPHRVTTPTGALEAAGCRAVWSLLDAGVCLSDAERQTWEARYPKVKSRLHVIPNGLHPFGVATHRKWRRGREPFVILFVGQLIPLKRVDRILKALTLFPAAVLRIVYHNPLLEDQLRTRASTLGIESRVQFVGRRSGVGLEQEYLGAHLLALPSEEEALPSVVTEALQSGLPVAASDVGGVAGQVRSAGILFDPNNDDGFCLALHDFVSRYDTYAGAAYRRSEEVRREFSVDSMIIKHVALYESLLGR